MWLLIKTWALEQEGLHEYLINNLVPACPCKIYIILLLFLSFHITEIGQRMIIKL
jgi:hypothetical protein